jgi:hypothetical protein
MVHYADPQPTNSVEVWDCDPRKRPHKGGKQRHQQQHQRHRGQQQPQPRPPPAPKFDPQWATDAELKEWYDLMGYPPLDAQAALTIPAPKPWMGNDPYLAVLRIERARTNAVAIQRLREHKNAEKNAEAKRIAQGAGDVSKAPRDAVIKRMAELGLTDPVLTDAVVEPVQAQPLPPPAPPPSLRDTWAARNRKQHQQPQPVAQAQDGNRATLASGLSPAAYDLLLKKRGITG